MAGERDQTHSVFGGGPVVWGGMQQLALDGPMSQLWSQDPGLDMFDDLQESEMHVARHRLANDDNPFSTPIKQEDAMTEDAAMGSGQSQDAPPPAPRRAKIKTSQPKAKGSGDTLKALRKTKRKAREGYRATTAENENDTEGETKRERFLERNRVAATKCRQKKKQWTDKLQERERELATTNTWLNMCALGLREELLCLKGECLRHDGCDCSPVHKYLDDSIANMTPSNASIPLAVGESRGSSGSSSDSLATALKGSSPETDMTSMTEDSLMDTEGEPDVEEFDRSSRKV